MKSKVKRPQEPKHRSISPKPKGSTHPAEVGKAVKPQSGWPEIETKPVRIGESRRGK